MLLHSPFDSLTLIYLALIYNTIFSIISEKTIKRNAVFCTVKYSINYVEH